MDVIILPGIILDGITLAQAGVLSTSAMLNASEFSLLPFVGCGIFPDKSAFQRQLGTYDFPAFSRLSAPVSAGIRGDPASLHAGDVRLSAEKI
jgi:hypothetical protein